MSAFAYTQLEDGEGMVIGPAIFSSTRSAGFSAGGGQAAQVSQTEERRIGITNRRVIVEQGGRPEAAQIVANAEVRRVYVRRDRFGTKVEKVETRGGQSLKLDLGGLNPMQVARLFEVFPEAEIGESKGLFGGFSRMAPPAAPTSRVPPAAKPARAARAPATARPAAPPAAPATGRSHIDDPDVHSLEDLRRYYPLPQEYEYAQTADGNYVVNRLSDGAHFPILLEAGMLGFDVPVQEPRRRKVTVEVIKKK